MDASALKIPNAHLEAAFLTTVLLLVEAYRQLETILIVANAPLTLNVAVVTV